MTVAAAGATQASTWLAASWARAHIRDLEDSYAAGMRGELEQQIVRVSKQFSVLSRFTAFLAVDRSQVVNKGGVLHQAVQPVETPAGWAGSPGNAPQPQVRTLLGGMAPQPMMAWSGPSGHAGSPPPPPSGPAALPGGPMASPSSTFAQRPALPGAPGGSAPPLVASASPSPASAPDAADFNRRIMPLSAPVGHSPQPGRRRQESQATPRDSDSPAASNAAYLVQLATLARELAAQANGPGDAGAVRLLRQRLTQWAEDMRSVGGGHDLIGAVEELITRLSAALAAPASLTAEAAAIAAALAALAAGAPPPPAKKRSRLAFWK
jgi:Ca-activated chloride channel family protein